MTEPLRLYRKNGLYLQALNRKGRGLFCDQAIAADEIIEVTPALVLQEDEAEKIRTSLLFDYVFDSGQAAPKGAALAMGAISFCNHLAAANATYHSERTPEGLIFTLRALHDIPAHTEICINYGLAWFAGRRTKT